MPFQIGNTYGHGAGFGNTNRRGHPKPPGAGSFQAGHPKFGGGEEFQLGELNPAWKGAEITYAGAHYRARQALAGRTCAECGSVNSEVALRAGCGTKFDEKRRVWYSPDSADYLPLCRLCHRAYDRINRKVG